MTEVALIAECRGSDAGRDRPGRHGAGVPYSGGVEADVWCRLKSVRRGDGMLERKSSHIL